MSKFVFDVKLFASIVIDADTVVEARDQLNEMLDCATANFGADEKGNPILVEVSLDVKDGAELVEIDGDPV